MSTSGTGAEPCGNVRVKGYPCGLEPNHHGNHRYTGSGAKGAWGADEAEVDALRDSLTDLQSRLDSALRILKKLEQIRSDGGEYGCPICHRICRWEHDRFQRNFHEPDCELRAILSGPERKETS